MGEVPSIKEYKYRTIWRRKQLIRVQVVQFIAVEERDITNLLSQVSTPSNIYSVKYLLR